MTMKRVALAAAMVLAMVVGWGLRLGAAGDTQTAPAAPVAPIPTVRAEPAKSEPAKPAPAKAVAPRPAAGRSPQAAVSADAGTVTPPPPVPDVEIPPIPEVDKDPFKAGAPPVRKKPPDVIEEGKRIFDREGRLEVDPLGRPSLVFDSGEKPMRLLESTWREFLEKNSDYGKKRTRWRVSGLVTVYEGANYLLLTRVVRIMPEEENL
jgi:hypothetical protein